MLLRIRQFLAYHAIAKSTRDSYGAYLQYWFDYCDWQLIAPTDASIDIILNFIAYCFWKTKLNGQQVDTALTSVSSYLKNNGINVERKKNLNYQISS